MRTYEGMFLIDNAMASDWDKVVGHVRDILEKRGAQVISTDKWGERKLAYRVDGHKRGTYMLVYFDSPTSAIADIRRDCQLSDTILRGLILRAEKRPEPVAEGPAEEKPPVEEEVVPEKETEGAAVKE